MVVAGGSADPRHDSAPGIEVVIVEYGAALVGKNCRRVELIGDVVLDVRWIGRRLRDVARQPLSGEENVIGDVAGRIALGQAEPIVGYRRAACFLDTLPASIIWVCGGHPA